MPLTHVTGVNLHGKFNDMNTTSVETQNELRNFVSFYKIELKIDVRYGSEFHKMIYDFSPKLSPKLE